MNYASMRVDDGERKYWRNLYKKRWSRRESERSPATTPSKKEGILCIYFSPHETCVQLPESANTLQRGYYAECGIGMFNFRFTVQ